MTLNTNLVMPILGKHRAFIGRLCDLWRHRLPLVILRVMIGHCSIALDLVSFVKTNLPRMDLTYPHLSFIALYHIHSCFIVIVISLNFKDPTCYITFLCQEFVSSIPCLCGSIPYSHYTCFMLRVFINIV